MLGKLAELIRGLDRARHGYSRALQAARVRASYQRAYFAPALFNLIPVKTDMIASMAVDSRWRLYYNDDWLASHTVEENAAVLIHEVSHLLREHEARKNAAAVRDIVLWNTADGLRDQRRPRGRRIAAARRSAASRQVRIAARRARRDLLPADAQARTIRLRERRRITTNHRPATTNASRLRARRFAQARTISKTADQAHTANGVRGNYRTMTAVQAGRRASIP